MECFGVDDVVEGEKRNEKKKRDYRTRGGSVGNNMKTNGGEGDEEKI